MDATAYTPELLLRMGQQARTAAARMARASTANKAAALRLSLIHI